MLRRLKVRARLMVVIAVPLALLLAVASPEVVQRWDRARVADRAAQLARAASDVAAAADAVQQERVLSAAIRAGSDAEMGRALADQRAATDAALQRGAAGLEQVAELAPSLDRASAVALDRFEDLDDMRTETDLARSIVPWVDPFAPLIDALLTVQEGLGSALADAGVGGELTQAGLLGRAKDAASAQAAQLAAATAWGALRGDQLGILTTLRADELAYRTAYLAATPATDRVDRRAEVQQAPVTSAGRVVDEVIADEDLSSTGGLLRWLDTGARRQVALRDVESARLADGLGLATDLGAASRRAATAYAGLAGVGLLLALALALLATRSITRPLRRLTSAADDLAEERLPRLVDALRNPNDDDERYLAATIEPLEVRGDDELAHLGRAFNAVQAVAVDVAAQQADLLRKGISELYVNLARRNQSLIERQIGLLDRLEAGEEDPEVLEHLFLLDHLATRMRRNAESLLVLAGADSGPRRSRSIDVVDVARAALSEVEEYERVELGQLTPATLHGPAVSDVAHLLAELLDNATSFSPPSTTVRIDGIRTGGSYQMVITDEGVGMSQDQLDELNAVLRDPPVTGLALGRSLGCLVAARLAARHGITVRLRASDAGGVSACVVLPRLLIDDDVPAPARPATDTLLALDEQVPITPVLPVVPQVTLEPSPSAPIRSQPSSVGDSLPATLREALPVAAAFDAGLQTLLAPSDPDAEPDVESAADPAGEPSSPPPPADGRDALVRRVPGASTPATAHTAAADRERRSPEEVRAILSRYRSGLRAGRSAVPEREEGS